MDFIDQQITNNAIPALQDFIRIPNLSRLFDQQWNKNGLLLKAANFLLDWINSQQIPGLQLKIQKDQQLSPIILGERKGEIQKTIVFYCHYDKQPPMEGWKQGLDPYKPVIKQGKLYGRGGADDGYATFSSIIAIKDQILKGNKLPRIVILIQGDQQSSSVHLPLYLKKFQSFIKDIDYIICLDSGAYDYQTVWLTNSLRGIVNFDVKIQVSQVGFHSGQASGIIPSSFRIFRILMDRIQNSVTGEVIKQIGIQIQPNRLQQVNKICNYKQDLMAGQFKQRKVDYVTQDIKQIILNKAFRPQVQIIGVQGIPDCKLAGNVLRPYTKFTVSIRLPPRKNPMQVKQIIQKKFLQQVPYNAKVQLSFSKLSTGWSSPPLQQQIKKCLDQSSLKHYGKQYQVIHQGGTISFLNVLNKKYPNAQFIVLGVLGPGSNAHGANQYLDIGYMTKLTKVVSDIIGNFNKHK